MHIYSFVVIYSVLSWDWCEEVCCAGWGRGHYGHFIVTLIRTHIRVAAVDTLAAFMFRVYTSFARHLSHGRTMINNNVTLTRGTVIWWFIAYCIHVKEGSPDLGP